MDNIDGMKIDRFPSEEEFYIRDCIISNTTCKLIFPRQIGVKWDETNKYFRSSIWTEDGELVSASYRKFTNLPEQPEFEPLNIKGDIEYIRKMDGSALIISKFKKELIVRTRGTVDAESTMENGYEIPILKDKYPRLFDNDLLDSEGYSIICEWYSPVNIIVERESLEPELWLTGIVEHPHYTYIIQDKLDDVAISFGVKRPSRYLFPSIEDMVNDVEKWTKGEGIVIYGNNGQVLKKTKADAYLVKHRIKSELSSENNLIQFYVKNDMPDYQGFYNLIETSFDHEIAEQLRGQISRLSDGAKEVNRILDHINDFVRTIKNLKTRKEQAQMIIESYGPTNRASFCFSKLDGKNLTHDQIIKIFWQVLKKS